MHEKGSNQLEGTAYVVAITDDEKCSWRGLQECRIQTDPHKSQPGATEGQRERKCSFNSVLRGELWQLSKLLKPRRGANGYKLTRKHQETVALWKEHVVAGFVEYLNIFLCHRPWRLYESLDTFRVPRIQHLFLTAYSSPRLGSYD